MPHIKHLALTTAPQQVVAQSNCNVITLHEDRTVVGGPQKQIIINKGLDASGDTEVVWPATAYFYNAPKGGMFFAGQALPLWVSIDSGSTTGIQDEEP